MLGSVLASKAVAFSMLWHQCNKILQSTGGILVWSDVEVPSFAGEGQCLHGVVCRDG